MEIRENIKNKLSKLPADPGVYIMRDKNDKVIYVGKAKILKNRVRQYFQSIEKHSPKTLALVSNIYDFEYMVTDNEIEALILECNLIKKYRPHYNIMLKDDKAYPYIKITIKDEYPKIMLSRKMDNDGNKYFGPYTSSQVVYEMIDLIKKIFMIPTCKRKFPADIGKGRPCLNYHIKQCFGACTGNVTKEEYRRIFSDVIAFIEGKKDKLKKELTEKMNEMSESLEFEKAAEFRNKLKSIEKVEEKQKMVSSANADIDIIAISLKDDIAFAEVFFVRTGKLSGHDSFSIIGADNDDSKDLSEIMTDFVKQFYNQTAIVPKEICLQYEIKDYEVIEKWLYDKRGSKVNIKVPMRGDKLKLLKLAEKNAKRSLDEYILNKMSKDRQKDMLLQIQKELGLPFIPERIEAYDISSISGEDKVGAMVVYKDGKPAKREYRKFKIKWVEGADDYASTKEVLYRRFAHALSELKAINEGVLEKENAKFTELPDLILMDGGIGHVNTATELFSELDIDVCVFGMVKDDKHRTRGLVGRAGQEITFSKSSEVFKFITSVQDEVHRFAIEYHRSTRGKRTLTSELENIPGVGEAKRKVLLRHFRGINKISDAKPEELASVKGIDKKTAQNIYDYFNK